MISKELIQENKQNLLAEKKKLEDLLKKISKPNPDVIGDYEATYPNLGDKPDENATEVAEYETNIAEERDMESRLRKVNAALSKIEKGSYGVCEVGGEDISEERLRAVPEAEVCVEHEIE